MKECPKARTSDFVVQESGDDTLIYDLNENKAVCLNETAGNVWKLCDGTRTVSEISTEVGKQMNSSVCEDLVLLALNQLSKDGLLTEGFEQDSRFTGLSRREVIKKIGIGSMVSLPIVSSILAPTATSAQSGNCVIGPGVCIMAGQAACAGCPIGPFIPIIGYSSTDGSCTTVSPAVAVQCFSPTTSYVTDIEFV